MSIVRQSILRVALRLTAAVCALTLFEFAINAGGQTIAAPAPPHKRILLFHSYGRDLAPWNEYSRRLRAEIDAQSPQPVDIHEASLSSSRAPDEVVEVPFINYIEALFAGRRPDLIVAIGGPAAGFVQRYRQRLFPDTPLLLVALDYRRAVMFPLAANETYVASRLNIPAMIENVFTLQPDVANIAVMIGAAPIERFWADEFRKEAQPYTNRVNFTYLNELPFPQMLERASKLEPRSAMMFGTMIVDAAGVPYEEGKALMNLRAVANAPIYSYIDAFFGMGIVGGPMADLQQQAAAAARSAVRILGGEQAGKVEPSIIGFAAPKYDWRELQRWGIPESRLPAGSKVFFEPPRLWDEYRWQFIAAILAVMLQSLMISGLLFERHRRHKAEVESRGRLLEVMHLSRAATAGAMSASIAHELNQPLGAILSNAETAELLLSAKQPDLAQLKEILADIRQADNHAADIIRHLRGLLKKKTEIELQDFDLNDVIRAAMHVLGPEAAKRNVTLQMQLSDTPLRVRADPVHLQQVVLNLATNGLDAMHDVASGATLTVQTARTTEARAEVGVIDNGTGIPADKIGKIFDTFFTTKGHGMGLGLSITRTIVETYGGKVWAQNVPSGGAAFRFTVPLDEAEA